MLALGLDSSSMHQFPFLGQVEMVGIIPRVRLLFYSIRYDFYNGRGASYRSVLQSVRLREETMNILFWLIHCSVYIIASKARTAKHG